MAKEFDITFKEVQVCTENEYMLSRRGNDREKALEAFKGYLDEAFILDDVKPSWVRWGLIQNDGKTYNGWQECNASAIGAQPVWIAYPEDLHRRQNALSDLAQMDSSEVLGDGSVSP